MIDTIAPTMAVPKRIVRPIPHPSNVLSSFMHGFGGGVLLEVELQSMPGAQEDEATVIVEHVEVTVPEVVCVAQTLDDEVRVI
jgi:hypothetical protein